ncbi:MAG: hybrid sensor histidine kinase/response regulator, partial [Lachnospiraceae bacterium]|nr:hybrid sensor histidine kinase/response regulator [Lachnospiraceae bacterium]
MYHCHIQFYLIGGHNVIFESIKEMKPFAHFTHSFWESDVPETEMVARADVLFVNLQGEDVSKMLRILTAHKKKEAELIILADREQVVALPEDLSEIEDMWLRPLSERELRFRMRKWQQNYKLKKDLCQSDQFRDLSINSSPKL